MKSCLRVKKRFIFLFLLYFVMARSNSSDPNGDQIENLASNDFNVSISIVNGIVNVNLNPAILRQNSTVYFLTYLHDDVSNVTDLVNVSVCQAFLQKENMWTIKPIEKNLYDFCNRSRKCSLGKAGNSLVRATVDEELSCQIFTTCSNFEDVFRIQVLSSGGGKEYQFQSGNMSILSENIPPFYKPHKLSYDSNSWEGTIGFDVEYFDASKLCGFGVNPKDSLVFVSKYYKVNDEKCLCIGERTVSYTGNKTKVAFDDMMIRKEEVLYFDYAVKSLASNKTTSSQRLKFESRSSSSTSCNITGGITHISWRPQWQCPDEEITEQAVYCFYRTNHCVPVCEASFYANRTFRNARTYSDQAKDACRKAGGCRVLDNVGHADFITVNWSVEKQRITCVLFRTCIDFTGTFEVKANSMNAEGVVVNAVSICNEDLQIFSLNTPAVPHSIHATDVRAKEVTITWKSLRCELEALQCEVLVVFNSEEHKPPKAIGTDGINNLYTFTQRDLPPNQQVTFQLYTKCHSKPIESPKSPLQRVTTKPAAPAQAANLNNIRMLGKNKIQLTWEYPSVKLFNGVPNETRIIGKINGTVVYWETLKTPYKKKIASANLSVNETQRCAYYQVKFCNAPHLCSDYSNRYRLSTCAIRQESTEAPQGPEQSSTEVVWIYVLAAVAVVVAVAGLIIYLCFWKQRKKNREKLPVLDSQKDQTGDYIPVGQLSRPGEYDTPYVTEDTLDKEECLEQLVT